MIKSVHIENLESHEDTTIRFEPGLNLICGLSNSGKSSLIRALGIVVNNNWNKSMVRTGCEFCRVKVETERGWVEAERGEKVNRWRCQENGCEVQNYKNVGTDVPDLATKILGMGERDRGAGIKELPNFQFQLERHYMLSEIGEKKATSNMVAVMMDNAIGLGGMEDLIKGLSADLLKDRKWLTDKQNEITEVKSRILDEKIYEGYCSLMKDIGDSDAEISEMSANLLRAEGYFSKYEEISKRKSAAEERLGRYAGFGEMAEISSAVERLVKTVGLLERAMKIQERISRIEGIAAIDVRKMEDALNDSAGKIELSTKSQDILLLEGKLETLMPIVSIDLDRLQSLCQGISQLLPQKSVAEKISALERRTMEILPLSSMDLQGIEKTTAELAGCLRRADNAEADLSRSREIWKRKTAAEKEFSELGKSLADSEKELDDLRRETGICPLCGRKFCED